MQNHKHIIRQAIGLTVYYVALLVATAGTLAVFPGLEDYLPVGGASELGLQLNGNSLEPVRSGALAPNGVFDGMVRLLLAVSGALLLMLPITWIYMGSRRRTDISQSFVNTVLLLPILVTGIVHIVQNSLALAFSLAGIVAGVRFRHTLKDTGDTIYLFAAILVGLAAGISAVDIALVVTIFFNFVVLALWRLEFASAVTGKQSFSRNWMTRLPEEEEAGESIAGAGPNDDDG